MTLWLMGALFVTAAAAQNDNGYPPGLFEHSPVFPDSVPQRPSRHSSQPPKHETNGCHHYGDWRYPYPQPC
jgi:hypothetical protein